MESLLAASRPGGASCLVSTTELVPAGGAHAAVAPAKFAPDRGRATGGVYAYERRYLDGQLRHAVVIDSKQSQLNRAELALQQAIDDGHPVLTKLPRVVVRYSSGQHSESYTDLQLPHRVFDGHVRAGTVGEVNVTDLPVYRAVRDASPVNARALLETSPVTLVFGGWDASRGARQGRWRSCLVGEIIGFCAEEQPGHRGGARVDPVGMQVKLPGPVLVELAEAQRAELSRKTYDEIVGKARRAKADERVSGSSLGLGGIPPALSQLAGVACDRIIRTHVLSFASLRQMRFGAGADGDAACRALLAALALNGLARSDAELYLRANCDLVEAGATAVSVDQRGGGQATVDRLDVTAADVLLEAALRHAQQVADVRWSGVVLEVDGNPKIIEGAVDEDGNEPS
jgi:CRISPR-associated protein Csb1